MSNEKPRVRFAPSPTGYLHIGGLRTALFNYLFAKHNNGKFILRIEDTDRNRFVEGAVNNLISTLKWIGLQFDEGPGVEGDFGPYFQSQRLNLYAFYANKLIEEKKAYYCFCAQDRLKQIREQQQAVGLQPKYDKHCLSLSDKEINDLLNKNTPHVIRLKVDPGFTISFDDEIRGTVEFLSDLIDDQVLIKSDGYPTYHLANVVDDHLMEITHVIRGEEWLPSTPKHILLYDYFNWEKPHFAHLPLLLNPDRSKLSKRQGDVAVEDYQKKGYLKEALINFVALLGWNAGDDKEFYNFNELIDSFTLDRVNKSGAIFNLEKLNWLNAEHLRAKSNDEILIMLKDELLNSQYAGKSFDDRYLLKVIEAMKPRVSFIKEFLTEGFYFFERPTEYDPAVKKKRWKEDSAKLIKLYSESLINFNPSSKEEYENLLKKIAEENNVGAGRIIHPLRLALSGVGGGPGIFDILFILGKEESIDRINKTVEALAN